MVVRTLRRRIAALSIASSVLSFSFPLIAAAAANLGTSADAVMLGSTANGAFTSLTGPVISSIDNNDMPEAGGTITLTAPAGFEFDTGGTAPTVVVTCTNGCGGGAADNINGLTSGSSIALGVTSSVLTLTLTDDVDGGGTTRNSLTWQNIRVRPTVSTATSADIIIGGTINITGLGTGSTMGTLKEIGFVEATGGSAIPDNTVGGAWTTLTGPMISEVETGDIGDNGAGTIILNAPAGFEFDTGGVAPTVLITRTGGSGADTRNINDVTSGTSYALSAISSTQLTFTVAHKTSNGVTNSLTWQNIRVRPTAALPLATGNIVKTGASVIVGVTNNVTNFGTLTEVASGITATTTALVSDNNPSTYGDSVTFTATVTGSSPTGTVEFYSGATLLGSDTLDGSFEATYTTSSLAAGNYSITAEYLGDMSNSASTSSAVNQVVNKKALTITASNLVKTYGTTYTFAGTEFGTSAMVGGDSVSSVTLNSSGAADTATVAGSPYSITASAAVGTGLSNYTITYDPGTFTVNQAHLEITADNDSKVYGTTNAYAGTEFTASGLLLTDIVTSVTLASTGDVDSATVAGSTYPIVASAAVGTGLDNYSIDYYDGALTVTAAHLEITADSTSKAFGTTLTFAGTEFTASGLLLTDMVTSVTLSSSGAIDTATVAGSTYPIVASAAVGTGLDNYSIDYYDGALTVTQATSVTNTVLRTPTPNSTVGTSVVLNAEVTGGLNPTGTVSFYSGAILIGSGSLANGSGTYVHVFTQAGSYDLTAQYGGDSNHTGSTSATIAVHIVDKDDADTVTTISSSGSSLVGSSVDFTATVNGAYNPTGTVEFYSDAVLIGTGSLNGSFEATLNHTFTQAGNYEITAHYLGDSNNNASVSVITVEIVLDQEVRKDTPATSTVLSVANPSTIGDMVVMTADVSGGYNPTGVVFFKDGGMFIGSGALVAGTATFSTDQLAVGSHDLTAEYQGDVNNNMSTSATVTVQVVQKMTSVTILANIPTPVDAPASVTFQVTVNGYFPTGTVTIHDDPSPLLTINLSNGSGSFTHVFTGEQTSHIFTAEYNGDVNNTTSVSAPKTVLVTRPSAQSAGNQNQGAGSNRGNNTQRAANITAFLANLHLGNLAPGAFGGADAPLAGQEKEFICSIQRSLPRLYTSAYLNSLAQVVSAYTGRSAEVIADWLRDPSVCADITEARLGVERVAQVELTPFYVTSEGFPLSKNDTWNKCVTGKFTYEDIQANPDRDRKGTPKSCADYHTGSSWYHPDHRMFFDWNLATKKLTLPAGYVITKDEAVSVR